LKEVEKKDKREQSASDMSPSSNTQVGYRSFHYLRDLANLLKLRLDRLEWHQQQEAQRRSDDRAGQNRSQQTDHDRKAICA
jgi:hypothetical protein